MSSFFSCQSQFNNGPEQRKCAFEGVSPCRDHVSHLICNAHSRLFGLVHQPANYCTDAGDVWSKINVYAASQNSLSIPLFMDNTSKVLMSEIKTFTMTVCNRVPSIKVDVFQDRIAYLLGVNMYGNIPDCNQSWLSEPNSALIVRSRNENVQYYNNLPQLHRILLFYANASNIRNSNTGSTIYLIPNLSLTYNSSSDTFAFVVPNKKILLKYTDNPNCIATPIVLDGRREIISNSNDQTFRPIHRPVICNI